MSHTPLPCPLGGRTKSVFDIFREDITSDLTDTPKENAFVEVNISLFIMVS